MGIIRNNRGQLGLVALMVTVLIILLAAFYIYPTYLMGGKDKEGKEKSPPIRQAHGTACRSNLNQIRSAINMYQGMGEEKPQALQELGVSSISKCPISNEPYSYDPNTGRVWCTTTGHERY